ncbi:MAG: DUF4349 domain-containing protein [Gemmatimonadaceae bacterium]
MTSTHVLLLSVLALACSSPRTGDSGAPAQTVTVGRARPLSSAAQSAADTSASASDTGDSTTTASTPDAQVNPTMLIRTGEASIEVDKLDPALTKIRQLATQVSGFVTSSAITSGRDQARTATFELKIPAARYDNAVSALGTIGKVETVRSTVEDVGEEFVDVTARINNARRLEARLVNLLQTRTGKLEEVLTVERELARVRGEIDGYEGRSRYLSTRAALSTLSITVHEPQPLLGSEPGRNPIAAALGQAWQNFVSFVAVFIASLGVLIPLGIVALGAWWIYRFIKRLNQA